MEIYSLKESLNLSLPLASAQVEAGFPSVADDHIEGSIDLQSYLITRPSSTFIVKVKGESMINAGILPGDLLIVDRSKTPQSGSIIIALYQGEFTVKRLILEKGGGYLKSENQAYPNLLIKQKDDFEIWGTVCHVIHSF